MIKSKENPCMILGIKILFLQFKFVETFKIAFFLSLVNVKCAWRVSETVTFEILFKINSLWLHHLTNNFRVKIIVWIKMLAASKKQSHIPISKNQRLTKKRRWRITQHWCSRTKKIQERVTSTSPPPASQPNSTNSTVKAAAALSVMIPSLVPATLQLTLIWRCLILDQVVPMKSAGRLIRREAK